MEEGPDRTASLGPTDRLCERPSSLARVRAAQSQDRSSGLAGFASWLGIFFSSCLSLGKVIDLSGPQFPLCKWKL